MGCQHKSLRKTPWSIVAHPAGYAQEPRHPIWRPDRLWYRCQRYHWNLSPRFRLVTAYLTNRQLDSPFQLQEHLEALYSHYTKSDHNNTIIPINRDTALLIARPPESVDKSLWLYELCRLLVKKANSLITGFFNDSPPCAPQNCPEMRASEWQYLCAVHDPPKSCSAIDYCCHTLNWAGDTLTSQKHFPSRLTLGTEVAGGSQQGVRQLTNIFRRVYRMFAHAWFQHRNVFCDVEGREGLYVFYKTVCDFYNLIPEENYTVPAEAEGLVAEADYAPRKGNQMQPEATSRTRQNLGVNVEREQADTNEDDVTTTLSRGATTRRHKQTPSVGSAVTSIAEGDEELHETSEHSVPLDTVAMEAATHHFDLPYSKSSGQRPEEPKGTDGERAYRDPDTTLASSRDDSGLVNTEQGESSDTKSMDTVEPAPEEHEEGDNSATKAEENRSVEI